jgi:hypothetical protein
VAVRVRKLARELDLPPEEVLEILRSIGFDRFRSEDDMLSDGIVERVRRARPLGRAPEVLAPRKPAVPAPAPAATEEGGDLMAQLVPGVVRQKGGATHRVLPRVTVHAPDRPAPVPAPPPPAVDDPTADRPAPRQVHVHLAEREALLAEREAALAEREGALAEREEALRAREAGWTLEGSLLALLEERGLRGLDEAERAVAALAGVHAFGRVLGHLVPADPEWVRRLLADRLVLAGPGTGDLGLPTVTVSEDRADVPGGDRLARALRAIGDNALLEGRRRILFTGIPPRWQPLVRAGLDRRVEAAFRPGGSRDANMAAEDVKQFDLAVLWNTELTKGAREIWAGARSRLVEVQADTFAAWLEKVPALLSAP